MRKGVTILLALIFTFFAGFLITSGLLFVNGPSTIFVDLEFANRINDTWAFVFENSGWATEHHMTNFIFTVLFSSFFLSLIPKKGPFKVFLSIVFYTAAVASTMLYAACGEMGEAFFRKLIGVILRNLPGAIANFYGYTSETVDDVALSDLPQSLLASNGALLILIAIFSFKVSGLSKYKKGVTLIFRFLVILVFTPTGFISTIKKEFHGHPYNIGFYAQMFLKLGLICVLFLEDYLHVTSRKGKATNVSVRRVIDIYVFLMIYMVIQWAATWNLTAWGLITSNVITVVLFFVFLVLKIVRKRGM